MTRLVAIVATGTPGEDDGLAAAMLEDVVDGVAEMQQVEGALVAAADRAAAAMQAAWPGMWVHSLPRPAGPDAAGEVTVAQALAAVAGTGAEAVALVAPDAPDLPALLLGKLFSALTSAEVAVCPADDGRLVAFAAVLPAPPWLPGDLSLESTDAPARLRAAAPSARAVQVGPGWHRVRSVDDARRLDPGLEGWESTRAWLDSTA